MSSFVAAFREGLFGRGDEAPTDVVVFKILEAYLAYRAVDYCWEWGLFIQNIGEIVLPLGIANYVDLRFMFENGVSIGVAFAVTVLIAAGFLRWNRYAYAIAMGLFHLQFAARFCLGEIPHSSNFVGIGILALGLGALIFERGTAQRRFVTGILVFMIGLAYTTGAASKLIATGFDWVDGRHLWIWIAEKAVDKYSEFGELTYNPVQRLILENMWLATLSLSYGLAAESLSWTFWFRKTRPFTATAMLGLHAGIFLTMRIMFSASMHIIAIVGFPWSRWIQRFRPDINDVLSDRWGNVLARYG